MGRIVSAAGYLVVIYRLIGFHFALLCLKVLDVAIEDNYRRFSCSFFVN